MRIFDLRAFYMNMQESIERLFNSSAENIEEIDAARESFAQFDAKYFVFIENQFKPSRNKQWSDFMDLEQEVLDEYFGIVREDQEKLSEGELSEGELSEGELPEGELPEGELPEGEGLMSENLEELNLDEPEIPAATEAMTGGAEDQAVQEIAEEESKDKMPSWCTKCGVPMEPGHQFCSECGHKMEILPG